jgi:hypothetical protein
MSDVHKNGQAWSLQRHRPRLEMKERAVVVAAKAQLDVSGQRGVGERPAESNNQMLPILPNAKIRDRLCTAVGCSTMQQRIQS